MVIFCGQKRLRISQEWLLAIYLVAQGPVAGATFPLQTPLTLHHPEALQEDGPDF